MAAFDPSKCDGGGKSVGNMGLLTSGKIGSTQSDISNSQQHCCQQEGHQGEVGR